jgi:hypothetical protein
MATTFYITAGLPAIDSTPVLLGTDYTQDANCQGAWFLDGTSTETDRSGNGNTLSGGAGTPERSSTVPSGYVGYSRDFEKDNNTELTRADADLTGLDITGNILSIVAWIKIESAGTYGIVSKYDADDGKRQYTFEIITNQLQLVLSSNGTSGTVFNGDTTTLTTATWYHIAVVANGTNVKFYINGSSDTASPSAWTSNLYNGTHPFKIGNRGGLYFDGNIDEVAVFDRELSATEISNIYTTGISGNKGVSDCISKFFITAGLPANDYVAAASNPTITITETLAFAEALD